jgi:hypothetical protein
VLTSGRGQPSAMLPTRTMHNIVQQNIRTEAMKLKYFHISRLHGR